MKLGAVDVATHSVVVVCGIDVFVVPGMIVGGIVYPVGGGIAVSVGFVVAGMVVSVGFVVPGMVVSVGFVDPGMVVPVPGGSVVASADG